MSTAVSETQATDAGQEQATETPATPETPTVDPEAPKGKTYDEDYVKKIRAEAAENRVKAKEAEEKAQTAADEKVNKVLEALGINKAEDADPVAAAEAQAQENATRAETAEAERDQARRELAIYKQAGKAGADTDLLLDSTSFLNATRDIAPDDAEAIENAIKQALENNPRFKAAQAAGQSGADFSGGSGEGQVTQEQFEAYSPSEKNELFKKNPTLYRKLTGRE